MVCKTNEIAERKLDVFDQTEGAVRTSSHELGLILSELREFACTSFQRWSEQYEREVAGTAAV